MDKWLEYFYGRQELPDSAILCAGTSTKETQKRILEGSNILNYRNDVQEYYVINAGEKIKTVVFNIIGSPVLIDILHLLKKGGTRNAYFVSFAGTKQDYNIGDYFIPTRVRCLDGITDYYEPGIRYVDVEENARKRVTDLFSEAQYRSGTSASVPSFFHESLEVKAALDNDKDISAIEMEASTALYFSKRQGISCSPLLIISDNGQTNIPDGFSRREEAFYNAMRRILGN